MAAGLILDSLAAQTDALHRDRTRGLHYESPLGTVNLTRALLPPETLQVRPPTSEEILAGRWLVAEIAAIHGLSVLPQGAAKGARPAHELPALRAAMARLEQRAAQSGQLPPPAYLSDETLRALLINPLAGARLTPLAHASQAEREHSHFLERDLPEPTPARAAGPLAPVRSDPPLIILPTDSRR